MAAPPISQLQSTLQAAVQSVQWTYSLFWQLCPQKGILVWAEGYYNGAIKTRKTVQPTEASTEEATLQRSKQLKELYESLSNAESNQQARRPSAALSPEDLTDSEWFYLMCPSFSFPAGVGLPGKAYARGKHVWLTGTDSLQNPNFCRAIIAKSSRMQTVVCIPLLNGVVELGTTDEVQEDIAFINQIKSFFMDAHHQLQPPKPALSEYSTSNPSPPNENQLSFHTLPMPPTYPLADPLYIAKEEAAEDEDDDDDAESDSGQTSLMDMIQNHRAMMADPSEVMQLDMSEEIRLDSLDDESNNLDSDLHMPAVVQVGQQGLDDSDQAETTGRWPTIPLHIKIQPPAHSDSPMEDPPIEDTHYARTISTFLHQQNQPNPTQISISLDSSFSAWTPKPNPDSHMPIKVLSQNVLKKILFIFPPLHTKSSHANSPTTRDPTPQDELSANHVLAERRRREKLNDRFIILRSLVPCVTKTDKASVLGDTIEYLKQLREKINELEAHNKEMEVEHRKKDKKKRMTAGIMIETRSVEVSIIELDALVEIKCIYREGLLLDIMAKLRELGVEVVGCQTSLSNNFFTAELRAKVRDHVSGRKVSIMEVKKAINLLIPRA